MPYEDEIPPYGDLIEPPEELDQLVRAVIGAAIEVQKILGPALPEEAYEGAMAIELAERAIPFERQKIVWLLYKGTRVAKGKVDMLVGGKLVFEIKAIAAIIPSNRLQTMSYLKIIKQPLGLLINFNVPLLREGIRRIIMSSN